MKFPDDWVLPTWVVPDDIGREELLKECRLAISQYQLNKEISHNPVLRLCDLTKLKRWGRLRACVKASLSHPSYSLEYNTGITLGTREALVELRINWLSQLEKMLLDPLELRHTGFTDETSHL